MRVTNSSTLRFNLSLGLGLLLASLAACGGKTLTSSTSLMNANGASMGTISFSQTGTDPVQVTLMVSGIPAGKHGVHVHDMGKCDPPDFMTAGGHFNPTGATHGDPASATHHTGDLGNLDVGADGTGMLSATSTQMSLQADSPDYLAGHAFIVHAGTDDLVTQPTGNSGARLLCGVIPAPQ